MRRSHRTASTAAEQRAARARRERSREQLRLGRRHLAYAAVYTVAAIVVYALEAIHPSWLTRTSTVSGVAVAAEPQAVKYGLGAGFLVIGILAARRGAAALDHLVRARSPSSTGAGIRLTVTAVGYVVALFVALGMVTGSVAHLLVGAGLAGVVLGIAGQQTLGNVFAGLVLIIARPFTVGDHVRIRSGALGGIFEGKVNGMSLTYVTLNVDGIEMKVPNSGMLAAAVGKLRRAGQTGGVPAVTSGSGPAARRTDLPVGGVDLAGGQLPPVRSRLRPPGMTAAVPAVPAFPADAVPAPAADSAGTSAVAQGTSSRRGSNTPAVPGPPSPEASSSGLSSPVGPPSGSGAAGA